MWDLGPSYSDVEPTYRSHLSVPPRHAVVLLGAGASVAAGCPLMRGFIDRAYDYMSTGRFTETERTDVESALQLYEELRRKFWITEEDVENIETLLSLADVARLVRKAPVEGLSTPGIRDCLSRFVDAVVTKSVSLPNPDSPDWLGGGNAPTCYIWLVRTLAYNYDRVSVITLNYDCTLEYACHCLGMPFTYNRRLGEGIEILKLHGSSNWLTCTSPSCKSNPQVDIVPFEFCPVESGSQWGFIGPHDRTCPSCHELRSPVLIAPTWVKNIESQPLLSSWSRALQVLSECDVFVAAGFSIPVSDAHIRHLLHLGFSSGGLRQAVAIVGSDSESANRWTSLFRDSWRNARLEVRKISLERAMYSVVGPALGVPKDFFGSRFPLVLDIGEGLRDPSAVRRKLIEALSARGMEDRGVDWNSVLKDMRAGKQSQHKTTDEYRDILNDTGLNWVPSRQISPSHDSSLFPTE